MSKTDQRERILNTETYAICLRERPKDKRTIQLAQQSGVNMMSSVAEQGHQRLASQITFSLQSHPEGNTTHKKYALVSSLCQEIHRSQACCH